MVGTVAAFSAAALVMTGATAASAHGDEPDRSEVAGERTVQDALARDLHMTPGEVDEMLDALAGSDELMERMRAELGDAFAGSWFDHEARTLVVATTAADAARTARAAGAQARVVRHSEQRLESVRSNLDALATADPDALSDAFSWTVDVRNNEVVLTVRAGHAGDFAGLRAQHGSVLRVVESELEPATFNHDGSWLDGGVQYVNTSGGWSCSVGFNLRNPDTGARYFLTAGHCGDAGHGTAHGGISIGPFVESFFPQFDDGLVRVDNSHWSMGPWVWTYPGTVTVQGARDSGVGTPVCKSGNTTQLTCGTITAKNVTVNYPQGTVFGLGQHDACTEPGDSGGATFSTSGGTFAEGMTSGGQMINGQCLEKHGMQNVTFYQEVTDSLSYYGPRYGIQLW